MNQLGGVHGISIGVIFAIREISELTSYVEHEVYLTWPERGRDVIQGHMLSAFFYLLQCLRCLSYML